MKKTFTFMISLLILSGNAIAESISFPLQQDQISSYDCLFHDESGNNMARLSFYFNDRTYPLPIRGEMSIVCHDRIYGRTDSILFPRLNTLNNFFSVWDSLTSAFIDNDNNGQLDIHDYLSSVNPSGKIIFKELRLKNSFFEREKSMGYFLTRFFDSNRFEYFCPTEEHYYGSDPLFRTFRDIMGSSSTQALYLATNIEVESGDILNVPHNILKNIWFHVIRGNLVAPTKETLFKKHLYFYWPADSNDPFTRKANQKLYKIVRDDSGDIAIGCVPQ